MRILSVLALLFWPAALTASPIAGYWSGAASLGGETRTIHLKVEQRDGSLQASYSIPSIGLEEIPIPLLEPDPQFGGWSAGHQMTARLEGERLVGRLSPVLLHGRTAQILLDRARPPVPAARERAVEFASRGLAIRGTLVSPLATGRYPAMVSLHGSGPSTRWLALSRARRFAQAGFVTLIYDKPGTGESEGDWTTTSLDDLAADGIAAMTFLREQPEVIEQQVGLWGHSQAGWVVSRIGAITDDVAFALVLAGGGARPQDVERFGYRNGLVRAGIGAEDVERAMTVVEAYLAYLRTGAGHGELRQALDTVAGERWAQILGLSRVLPDPATREKWAWVATYDPAPDIASIRFPLLVMFAERDPFSPPEGLSAWESSSRAGGNADVETRVVPAADHHFLVVRAGGGWPSIAAGYFETQFAWLDRHLDNVRSTRPADGNRGAIQPVVRISMPAASAH